METALVALAVDLLQELDKGSVSLLVLQDISAAFHNINHGVLLSKCCFTVDQALPGGEDTDGGAGRILFNTLTAVACRIPQGPVLPPVLFNIYVQ